MGSIRRLTDIAEKLVDGKTGVIKLCYELQPEPDAPQLFHYYAHTSNTAAFSRQSNFRNTGGVATTRRVAMAKAIGEAVERYCSALFESEELPLTSYDQAPFACVPPERFRYFLDEQFADPEFPYRPFERNTPVRWTPAIDLKNCEEVHVPACAVWMPYYFDVDLGEVPVFQPISSGLSAHCSLEEATLGGVLEVVERDAFSMTWQGRLSHPRIRIETLSDANHALARKIEATGDELFLLNATTDLGIPVVMGVARGARAPAPPLVVSAAAELDPEEAVRKALEEIVHTRRYMREVQDWSEPFEPGENWSGINEQIHHLRLWGDRAMLPHAQFLTASRERIDWSELPNVDCGDAAQSLRSLVARLDDHGFRAYAADLTTPDVRALGMRVVRALVPGLHPFFIGHRIRARNCARLFEVPQRLGLPAVAPGGDNPVPHPFP